MRELRCNGGKEVHRMKSGTTLMGMVLNIGRLMTTLRVDGASHR